MVNIPANQQGLIRGAAAAAGLPLPLVAAQVNMESGFNPKAVSGAGAQGEFQFMPGTFASQHTGGSPFNPNDEARAYAKLMSTLVRQYHGNVRNALAAYNAGPGNIGAGFGYADKILAAAGLGSGLNARPGRGVVMRIPGQPPQRLGTQIGGGLNTEALAQAVLQKEANRPINTTGKVSFNNPLKDYAAAEQSGHFNAPTMNATSTIPGTPGSGSLRTGGLDHLTGHGSNLNPLGPDWHIGRTDMGVDANAAPGTPIEAINDSKVVQIVPNWFRGQPLVLMQLTSGPDAGKYWYVSEQIAQLPHIGQHIQRGGTVAVYAPSGTGIEIGWGDPNTASRTAAGPHYTEGAVTPEGLSFLHHVLHH